MAVIFKSLTVVPRFGQQDTAGFNLYWEISGQNFTPSFQVQSAPTESGPWSNELTAPTSNLFALGLGPVLINQQAIFWFRVQVLNGSSVVATSQPMDHRNRMIRRDYLRYREILRRKHLGFEKTPCSPGWLLRRRIYGTVCPLCTDEILNTPSSSECLTCYGTGITGGYYDPVAMRADWFSGASPRNADTSKEEAGPTQVLKASIKLFPVPDAKSEDIWIDQGTRYRYLIEKNVPEQYGGSPIGQTLSISRLPSQHPVYSFPIADL